MFTFTVNVELSIPQLTIIGEKIVAALDDIKAAVQEAADKLSVEMEQIATRLENTVSDAEKMEVANSIRELGNRIANIIPDDEPMP